MEQLKSSGDISKIDLKKSQTSNKSKDSNKSSDKKSTKEEPKPETKKSTVEEEEAEDEKNSRFHYFDSGPHWCKTCDRFVDNVKNFFNHIHSKDHLSKQKELKTPWITKEYTKEMEKQSVRHKDQLVVASKGMTRFLIICFIELTIESVFEFQSNDWNEYYSYCFQKGFNSFIRRMASIVNCVTSFSTTHIRRRSTSRVRNTTGVIQ